MDETKKALANTINRKATSSGMVTFLQTGLNELGKEVNNTIDSLFGTKWPGSSMITADLADYEKKLIAVSEDTVV